MAEGHDGMPSKTRPLIDDARKFVQEKLVENLEYLSRSELKAYVKYHDENKGFTMMRDILPPEVSDDEIQNGCRYLGNSLYHKSQDLAMDKNYKPKRKLRSSMTHAPSMGNTDECEKSSSLQPQMSDQQRHDPRDGDGETVANDTTSTTLSATSQSEQHPAGDSETTDSNTRSATAERYCTALCKHGRAEGPPMIRCCLC